jgi:phospholipid/cholesterol/gamma-HCH transport system substrate-binding protein
MRKITTETFVGLFLIAGLLCLAYLSIKLGDLNVFGKKEYVIKARFSNIAGLKEGSDV